MMGFLSGNFALLQRNRSEHVMIISDRGLEALGVVKKVADIIESSGIQVDSYLDVLPNPTVEIVDEAFTAYQKCA